LFFSLNHCGSTLVHWLVVVNDSLQKRKWTTNKHIVTIMSSMYMMHTNTRQHFNFIVSTHPLIFDDIISLMPPSSGGFWSLFLNFSIAAFFLSSPTCSVIYSDYINAVNKSDTNVNIVFIYENISVFWFIDNWMIG